MTGNLFLPGVPAEHVVARLEKAGGNEVASGKLSSAESSAALAINAFGWFMERPADLPPLPHVDADYPASVVDVEYCARFPWRGGRHPWLDAVVETERCLIGVESKRFEPYRDKKTVSLSEAYDRPVWGDGMKPFESIRDALRSGELGFAHLDAAQLLKHAFGLATDGARKRKAAKLVYLFAEPEMLGRKPIGAERFRSHRAEVARFSELVGDAAVSFTALSYREWLDTWPRMGPVGQHREAIIDRFAP